MILNFWGGPCSGKSTAAPEFFAFAKKRHKSVELVREYIKDEYVYRGLTPKEWDQEDIFNGQLQRVSRPLNSGVRNVVSDSPLQMQTCYAQRFEFPAWEALLSKARTFERRHKVMNILLDPTGIPYEQTGRYEDAAKAKWMHRQIANFLDSQVHEYEVLRTLDLPEHYQRFCDMLE
jgi:hypothetical protein